jgi:uncharacterized cupredoxin-like copper-binding protein
MKRRPHPHQEVRVLRQTAISLVVLVLLGLLVPAAAGGAPAQKITITMRDFSYTPDRVTLQAGVPVELTIVNKGKVGHEFIVYVRPKPGLSGSGLREWAEDNSYFRGRQVAVEGRGVEVERKGTTVAKIQVSVGKSTTVKFTPAKKGTFEMACLIEGHYEAGQKGTLTIQ